MPLRLPLYCSNADLGFTASHRSALQPIGRCYGTASSGEVQVGSWLLIPIVISQEQIEIVAAGIHEFERLPRERERYLGKKKKFGGSFNFISSITQRHHRVLIIYSVTLTPYKAHGPQLNTAQGQHLNVYKQLTCRIRHSVWLTGVTFLCWGVLYRSPTSFPLS